MPNQPPKAIPKRLPSDNFAYLLLGIIAIGQKLLNTQDVTPKRSHHFRLRKSTQKTKEDIFR